MMLNLYDAPNMQAELDECQRIYTKSREAIVYKMINL